METRYLPSEMAEAIRNIPGGGSGGTTDYNELTNKPSINGVTISGSQTSQSLKLQRELTKAEYDALTESEKKDGTVYFITDLDTAPPEITKNTATGLSGVLFGSDGAVTAKELDAADGAASSAALGTETAARTAADTALAAELGTYVRPNLLDNWYFGNPVNQRGQTEYTDGGYTVDRWYKIQGPNYVSLKVNSDNVSVNRVNSTWYSFGQKVEDYASLRGRKVTLSALVEPEDAYDIMLCIGNDFNSKYLSNNIHIDAAKQLITLAGTITDDADNVAVSFYLNTLNVNLKIYAVKLELGDTQTLAHQDTDGNWVLNEIPNYAEQLARCMRYYQTGSASVHACEPYTNVSEVFGFSFPVEMRATPTMTCYGFNGSTVSQTAGTIGTWGKEEFATVEAIARTKYGVNYIKATESKSWVKGVAYVKYIANAEL